MKTLAIGLFVTMFSSMEANAQQAASGRELKIVSFTEADKSDFDVTTPSNFSGKLSSAALVKVFMPGEVESTDPRPAKAIERKLSPGGGGYANYIWVEQHCNSLRIVPKGNLYQSLLVYFSEYGISKYTVRNKKVVCNLVRYIALYFETLLQSLLIPSCLVLTPLLMEI